MDVGDKKARKNFRNAHKTDLRTNDPMRAGHLDKTRALTPRSLTYTRKRRAPTLRGMRCLPLVLLRVLWIRPVATPPRAPSRLGSQTEEKLGVVVFVDATTIEFTTRTRLASRRPPRPGDLAI